MTDGPWWTSLLQPLLWSVLMAVTMSWLARSRLRSRAGQGPDVLRLPHSILVVGLAGAIFMAALGVLSMVYLDTAGWLVFAGVIFFGVSLGFLWMLVEYFLAWNRVEPNGLRYHPAFGRAGFLLWRDVTRLSYSKTLGWFRLESVGGAVVRVSILETALPTFASAAIANVPTARIDSDARPVIERTAAGEPPSLWDD